MKRLTALLVPGIIMLLFVACKSKRVDQETHGAGVEITATHNPETGEHLFNLSADSIASGWTTFRFTNASPDDHFAVLWKFPEDKGEYSDPVTFEKWKSNVTVPFQEAMDNIIDPEIEGEAAFAPFGNMPDWYQDVEAFGGPGLTTAGRTSETTVNLVPGRYAIECYVKNEDEEFHSYLGMVEMITVTEESNGASEPEADLEITVSSTRGIEINDNVTPGLQTVAIHFEDQKVYEHMIGHDLHLVRLDGEDIQTVAQWMNWMVPGALVSPAPGTFLGGSQTMKAGDTAYFSIDLEPGEYAWISEVPAENEMWSTFSVNSLSVNK